jgi:hypothetical protein
VIRNLIVTSDSVFIDDNSIVALFDLFFFPKYAQGQSSNEFCPWLVAKVMVLPENGTLCFWLIEYIIGFDVYVS